MRKALLASDIGDLLSGVLGAPTLIGLATRVGQTAFLENSNRVADLDTLSVLLDPILKALIEYVKVSNVDGCVFYS